MPFRNRLIALGSVLGALILVFIATLVFSPETVARRGIQGSLMPGFELAKLAKIELSGKAAYSLAGTAAGWTVSDATGTYPARKDRIGYFVEAIQAVASMEKVGSNKSSWGNFGIGGPESYHLRISLPSGMAAAEFDTGLYDTTSKYLYVRPVEGEAVYAVDSGFASYLKSLVADWQDKAIFTQEIAPLAVGRVSMSADLVFDAEGTDALKESWTLTLDKATGVWKAEPSPPLALNPQSITTLLGSLVKLEAMSYLSAGKAAIEKPVATLSFETLDGASYKIQVGPKDANGNFPLALEGGSYTYTFSPWTLKGVFKPLAELLAAK